MNLEINKRVAHMVTTPEKRRRREDTYNNGLVDA